MTWWRSAWMKNTFWNRLVTQKLTRSHFAGNRELFCHCHTSSTSTHLPESELVRATLNIYGCRRWCRHLQANKVIAAALAPPAGNECYSFSLLAIQSRNQFVRLEIITLARKSFLLALHILLHKNLFSPTETSFKNVTACCELWMAVFDNCLITSPKTPKIQTRSHAAKSQPFNKKLKHLT